MYAQIPQGFTHGEFHEDGEGLARTGGAARGTALTHLSRKVNVLDLAKISGHRDLKILSTVYYRDTPDQIAARLALPSAKRRRSPTDGSGA